MAFAGIGAILLALLLTYIGSISLGTPAATAVLLLYSQPIFTVLLSRVLLGEQVTWVKSIALLLGISGVLVVLNPLRLGLGVGVGQALAISSGLLYALYIIASKKVGGFNPMTKTALSFSGALALLFPAYWLIGLASPGIGVSAGVANINVTQVALLLGLVVIGTILPYVALNFGLEHMPASDSGLTLLVEPIVASALGSVFLGQGLGLNQLVGGALIVASILVLNRGTSTYLRGSASNRPRVLVVRPASKRSFAPGGRRPTLSVRRNDTNPTRPESREDISRGRTNMWSLQIVLCNHED
jgi:drug/metabolite transporter (DMT)-like permease